MLEAESFDAAPEGIGYHDSDAVNTGGAFRPNEGVDIAASARGGYYVTSTVAGEWLAYTVQASAAGAMNLQVRVASGGPGGAFHVELDGADLTGPILIPDTGGGEIWYTITRTVTVAPSVSLRRKVRLVMDSNGPGGFVGNFNYLTFASVRPTPEPSPSATPTSPYQIVRVPSSYTWIPGTFEVEDFEPIHEDTGYFDTDAINLGGAYRPSEGVDIEATTDVGGGYDVGWTRAGEWLEYAWANVPSTGHYVLGVRVASSGPGGVFHLEVGGVNVTGPVAVPDTGGPQSWRTLSLPVLLNRGIWKVRLVMDSDGPNGSVGSFNSFSFDPGPDTAPVAPRPTAAPTPTFTPTATPTLLSRKRPVVVSSVEKSTTLASYAVDGNTSTRWSSAFKDPQWIYVDLGATHDITRVALKWEAAYAKAYQIQTSPDAVRWTTIYARTASNGGLDDFPVAGRGRYVRMYGTVRATIYGYSLWEFEVYGFPAP